MLEEGRLALELVAPEPSGAGEEEGMADSTSTSGALCDCHQTWCLALKLGMLESGGGV